MIAKASLKYHRVSSRKIRDVARLIKGKDVTHAFSILTALNKRAANDVSKLLKSAVANAKIKGLEEAQLYISNITANNGPVYKRYRAEPFGRASVIKKPLSHIDIELELKVESTPKVEGKKPVKKKKVQKVKKTSTSTKKTKTRKVKKG